jgi:hypothetical protein
MSNIAAITGVTLTTPVRTPVTTPVRVSRVSVLGLGLVTSVVTGVVRVTLGIAAILDIYRIFICEL